jgi:hypothetical protein
MTMDREGLCVRNGGDTVRLAPTFIGAAAAMGCLVTSLGETFVATA